MVAEAKKSVYMRLIARALTLVGLVLLVMVASVALAVSLHIHTHGLAHTLYHTAGVKRLVDTLGYRTVHGLYHHVRALVHLP